MKRRAVVRAREVPHSTQWIVQLECGHEATVAARYRWVASGAWENWPPKTAMCRRCPADER